MILRNLFRREVRSLLTLAGIAIGIAAVVALGALANGLTGYYALLGGSGADLLVRQAEAVDGISSAINEEVDTEITRFPEVETVAATLITFLSTEGVAYFVILGYDAAEFAIGQFEFVEGDSQPNRWGGGNL